MERAFAEEARAQNTTPELLAIDSLQERFAPSATVIDAPDAPHDETVSDYWKDFIGVINSRETFPDGSNLSEDTGKKFAEGIQKRELGKL